MNSSTRLLIHTTSILALLWSTAAFSPSVRFFVVRPQISIFRSHTHHASTTSLQVKQTVDPELLPPQLHGAEEYLKFLQNSSDDICVVRFSANWCKLCKSLDLKYHKLAAKCHDQDIANIRFAEVMYKGNEALCDAVGVKVFPCFHVYAGCQGLLCSLDAHENDYHHIMNDLRDELNRLLESRESDDYKAKECEVLDADDALGHLKNKVSGYDGVKLNEHENDDSL